MSNPVETAKAVLVLAQSEFLSRPSLSTKERLEAARATLKGLVGPSTAPSPTPSLPWQLSGVYPTK